MVQIEKQVHNIILHASEQNRVAIVWFEKIFVITVPEIISES